MAEQAQAINLKKLPLLVSVHTVSHTHQTPNGTLPSSELTPTGPRHWNPWHGRVHTLPPTHSSLCSLGEPPHALRRKSTMLIRSPSWTVVSVLLSDPSSISRLDSCLFKSPRESSHPTSHRDTALPTVTPHGGNRNKAPHHGTH